jgi:prepilin-type N-terminal cleavage/methylation domain-containing protein/prepilin-type processing-associated H-X9-DG protein
MGGIRQKVRSGFSLVELLVVIGIIAVLISILLPTLKRAREQGNAVQCMSNLRQMGIILQMYMNDNQGWLFPVGNNGSNGKPTTFGTQYPPHERWPMRVDGFDLHPPDPLPYNPAAFQEFPYDPIAFPTEPFTPKIMTCPSDQDPYESHSYVLNQHLADKRIKASSRHFGVLPATAVIVAGEKITTERDYYMEVAEFDRIAEKYRHGITRGSNYLYFDGHVDTELPDKAKTGMDPWEPPIPDQATTNPTP